MTWREYPGDVNGIRVTIQATKPPPPRKHLSVRIVGPDGTAPARVTLEFGNLLEVETQTARDGAASIDADDQPVFMRAFAAQGPRGEILPWAPTRVDVPAGSKDVQIRMEEGLSIEGRVLDEKRRPISGMTVVAQDSGMFGPHRLSWARSAPDGAFRVEGLGPEDVDLIVEQTVDTPTSAPVRARGGDRGVALTVRKSAPSLVRVVDAKGLPVAAAHFAVLRHFQAAGGSVAVSEVLTETLADGTVDVPPLDPGLHLSLKVEPPKDRDDLSPLEIDPWTPAPGAVTVPPGFTATLKVVDGDGRPVKARVTRLIPPEAPGDVEGVTDLQEAPDREGLLRVRALPFGPTRFTASPVAKTDVFPRSAPVVEVDENRRSGELRVPTRGLSMTVRAEGAGADEHVGLLFADLGALSMPLQRFAFKKDGTAELEGVAPGNFRVYVFPGRGVSGPVGRIDVSGFAGAEVRVPMAAPAVLRVRVKVPPETSDLEGIVLDGGEPLAHLKADGNGRLVCEILPPGRYAVRIFAATGKRRFAGSALVVTGNEPEIELVEEKD
jgi:hypothetical protein